jgi:hypothetical protein
MFSGGYLKSIGSIQQDRSCFGAITFIGLFTPAFTNDNERVPKFGSKFPGYAEAKRAYLPTLAVGGAGNNEIGMRKEAPPETLHLRRGVIVTCERQEMATDHQTLVLSKTQCEPVHRPSSAFFSNTAFWIPAHPDETTI